MQSSLDLTGLKLFCLVVIVAGTSARPANGQIPKNEDIRILENVLPDTDDSTILTYLAKETTLPVDHSKTAKLIEQLGSPNFKEREQASAVISRGGPCMIPLLRASHLAGAAERNRRLNACVELIQQNWNDRRVAAFRAAVRLLIDRQPKGTVDCLLRLLPMLHDDELSVDVQFALDTIARRDNQVIRLAEEFLTDGDHERRAFAGYLLARRGSWTQRVKARALLNDSTSVVRLRTAQGFLGSGDKSVVPVLISLLDGKPVFVAWQAEELLSWAAGEKATLLMPVVGTGREAAKCRDVWKEWWDSNEQKLDLNVAVKSPRRPMLLYLHAGADAMLSESGSVIGCDGRVRWTTLGSVPETRSQRPLRRVEQFLNNDRCLMWSRGPIDPNQFARSLFQLPELNEHDLECRPMANIGQWSSSGYRAAELHLSAWRVFAGHTVVSLAKQSVPSTTGHGYDDSGTVDHLMKPVTSGRQQQSLHIQRRPDEELGVRRTYLHTGGYLEHRVKSLNNPKSTGTPRFQECRAGGNKLWESSAPCQAIIRLRNGNFVVAAGGGQRRRIYELDKSDRLVWEAPSRDTLISSLQTVFSLVRLGFDDQAVTADDEKWFGRRVDDCAHPDPARRVLALNALRFEYLARSKEIIPLIREALNTEPAQLPAEKTRYWSYSGSFGNLLQDLGLPRK